MGLCKVISTLIGVISIATLIITLVTKSHDPLSMESLSEEPRSIELLDEPQSIEPSKEHLPTEPLKEPHAIEPTLKEAL